jgi:hypothetical protein
MANLRTADPFDLMLNPQAIVHAMEQSERLKHLQRRVYRPLDRPIIPRVANGGNAAAAGADDEDDDSDIPLDA